MKAKILALGILILSAGTTFAANKAIVKSTANDQSALTVTVYNNNIALVKDTRKIDLPLGVGELKLLDIAAQIMPQSVQVNTPNQGKTFFLLEQNYRYDLINPTKLLDKYVGKKIKIINFNEFQDRKETIEAVLLSNNNGQVYKIGNEIYLGYPGYKVLPGLPQDLVAHPTLVWLYRNQAEGPRELEISYLTNNITWTADYTATLNENNTRLNLFAWASVSNKSGSGYKNASLKLVAGKVNREAQFAEGGFAGTRAYADSVAAAPSGFSGSKLSEYHLYDLGGKTTIKDNQTKQISLLEAKKINIRQELVLEAGNSYYYTSRFSQVNQRQPVICYIKFKNKTENQLGIALPRGVMRVYKKDLTGELQFLGENRIKHTPKGEEVKIKVGEAFDIIAEKTQTDYRRLTNRLHESEWNLLLKNHKDKQVKIIVQERLMGNWTVLESNYPYRKVDANHIEFNIAVPSEQEVIVRYRIKVGI